MRRSIHDLLKESSKPSEVDRVVKAIDKACSEGITESSYFSVIKIKAACKKLQDALDADEFDRDSFFKVFLDLYAQVMAPDRRAKRVFHPSQLLDACPRMLYYSLSGEVPTTEMEPISGQLQRIFDVGTWHHIYIQNILLQIGMLEGAEVPVVDTEYMLEGKADGVFKREVFSEKVLLEIKTMNSYTFSRAVWKPFDKHEFQASLYARNLGCKKILFLYIDKNTSELKEFLVPVNLEMLEKADKKTEKVRECLRSKTAPPRTCKTDESKAALDCPYRELCFSTKD